MEKRLPFGHPLVLSVVFWVGYCEVASVYWNFLVTPPKLATSTRTILPSIPEISADFAPVLLSSPKLIVPTRARLPFVSIVHILTRAPLPPSVLLTVTFIVFLGDGAP